MEFFEGQDGFDIQGQVEGIGIFVSARKSTSTIASTTTSSTMQAQPAIAIAEAVPVADISNPVWENEVLPLLWRDAMYAGKCDIMNDLYNREKDYFLNLISELGNDNVSYVEVGCGTAELGSVIVDQIQYCVGVDINPIFIKKANELHPNLRDSSSAYLLEGNAVHLNELMHKTMPAEFWKTKRIVSIVMNTFGILPECIRGQVIEEMLQLAGDDGVVVVGCWHSGSFHLGVEHFYKQNAELTGGLVTDDMCDFEGANIMVPSSGYSSHWWSEAEIMEFFEGQDGFDIQGQVEGIGIFVSARKATFVK
jgi:SAM-dependent methyltransferase